MLHALSPSTLLQQSHTPGAVSLTSCMSEMSVITDMGRPIGGGDVFDLLGVMCELGLMWGEACQS